MSKLKASILTGFLGAGKTTLLNRVLSERADERIAVIVNEYGEVGIDGKLIVETRDEVVELNNGCICCTVREDLIVAIKSILNSGRPIDRVVIETSGLADPAPVIQSFILDDEISRRLELDAIVTVVDARYIERQLSQDEAVEQITFADILLLNKTDLESEDRLADIERQLRRLNSLAEIIKTRLCAVSLDKILDRGAFDLKNILTLDPAIFAEHVHEHDQRVRCVAIREQTPVNSAAFNSWLNRLVQDRGPDLFRMKGVINFANEARRFVFHGVHMTMEGRPGRPWTTSDRPVSELVFIGRDLDEGLLREGFASCLDERRAMAS
ncbi:MAG: GTP-binding protein [Mesorhizobium sp.]